MRERQREGRAERRAPLELPAVTRALSRPRVRVAVRLPAVAALGLVVGAALFGAADPQANPATAITWNLWFTLVFVVIAVAGRGWCLICPFGSLAEWAQRLGLRRRGRPLTLGRTFPQALSRYGYLVPVGSLVALTWVEERLSVADGAAPVVTGYLLLALLVVTLASFLVFERRTYCRYLCPLSGLVGVLGAVAPVAGFRSRRRSVCRGCQDKECLRGSDDHAGCPWYAWPGGEESNLSCGLCGECVTGCPDEQVALRLTPPLDSVIGPRRRRADVGWSVAVLLGLVVHEQVHGTNAYRAAQTWLERLTGIPGSPNPVLFLLVIAAVAAACALPAALAVRLLASGAGRRLAPGMTAGAAAWARPGRPDDPFVYRRSPFRALFLPLMYACIPLVGADYLAARLPALLLGAPLRLPLSVTAIVRAQVIVLVLGVLASGYAAWRIAVRGVRVGRRRRRAARWGMSLFVLAVGTVLVAVTLVPLLAPPPASPTDGTTAGTTVVDLT